MHRLALLLLTTLLLAAVPAASAAVEVFPEHPRLFFRAESYGPRSITLAELRQRAADSRYQLYLERMGRGRGLPNRALHALLLDDPAAVRAAIEELEQPLRFDSTTDDGRVLMWKAMAFDWLYSRPEFGEQSKKIVIADLVRGMKHCREIYYSQGTHVFHTRMYGYPAGVAIAALALAGHCEEAQEQLEWARRLWTEDLFPARQLQGGAVHSSLAYGRKYTMWLVGHFLAAWYTATGEDFWDPIRREQEDWAWREALFVIAAQEPRGLLARFGDCFDRRPDHFSFRVVSERAFYYDEPAGFGYLNELIERYRDSSGRDSRPGVEIGSEYQVLLYWDPDRLARPRASLPTRMLFGPEGVGMACWRSGWGPDDSFVFFKCGDYFDNHGHFDAGHVEVFRRAPLLIETGSYRGGTDTDHYRKYFHNSVAHNTIQVVDRTDPEDSGCQRSYANQGMGTIKEYLATPEAEYGDVIDYRDEPRLAYLAADFGAAYPAGRVERVRRELAWIDGRFLVVVDQVRVTDSRYQPRVLWHYPVKPSQLAERSFTVADSGARAVVSLLAPAAARIDTVAAFTVAGQRYPPGPENPALGAGRAESFPTADSPDYLFVHLIDVADQDAAPAEARLEQSGPDRLRLRLPGATLVLEGPPGARTRVALE